MLSYPSKSISFQTNNSLSIFCCITAFCSGEEFLQANGTHIISFVQTIQTIVMIFLLTPTTVLLGFFFFFFLTLLNPFTLGSILQILKTLVHHLASYLLAIPGAFWICCLLHKFNALPTPFVPLLNFSQGILIALLRVNS